MIPEYAPRAVRYESGSPLVRGRALLGLIGFAKQRRGPAVVEQIVAEASPALREVLDQRIRVGGWYHYASYIELLRAMDGRIGRGDLAICREAGRWAGAQDLGSMFRIYATLASAERLIRSCRLVWPQYYRNAGRMEALAWKPERTVLRITGFDSMDPAHCRLMEGWMISTMEQIGCRVSDDARETACTTHGAAHHEFACRWTGS